MQGVYFHDREMVYQNEGGAVLTYKLIHLLHYKCYKTQCLSQLDAIGDFIDQYQVNTKAKSISKILKTFSISNLQERF